MADERTEKNRAVDLAITQIEKQFGKGSIMKLGSKEAVVPISVDLDGLDLPSTRRSASAAFRAAASSRSSARSRPARRRSPAGIAEAQKRAAWRPSWTRSTRSIPSTRASWAWISTTCSSRSPTTGEQALEIAEALIALERGRRGGGRLGGGAGSQGGTRRRDGRQSHGPAGPADVAGAAQADRLVRKSQDLRDLHQPDPREDRRDVRQSGNDDRRHAR